MDLLSFLRYPFDWCQPEQENQWKNNWKYPIANNWANFIVNINLKNFGVALSESLEDIKSKKLLLAMDLDLNVLWEGDGGWVGPGRATN